jgi:two-component system, NtrC family, sensor kinase
MILSNDSTSSKQKILIVEDEAILAESLQETLEEMGYVITGIADTAMQAIMKFFADEPDLILMDIHLKDGMDGIKAAEKIREQKPVPIVFLTANQDNATFERAKISGALGYVLKPFQLRELQIVIEIALNQFNTNKIISGLENSLLNAEKLSTIGAFTTGIIHDIRSPLVFIQQAYDNLKRSLNEDNKDINTSTIKESMRLIEKGKNNILNTIKNYSAMIEATETEIGTQVSIYETIKNSMDICFFNAIENNIKLKEITSNKETTVWCGKIALFQVIVNLLKNSCDALVKTHDPWIEISWKELNSEQIELKITDSGAGIPTLIQEKIFEPLYTTKLPGKGMGIGLNLCKKILEKFHGSLELDKNAKNTCFIMKLLKNKTQ